MRTFLKLLVLVPLALVLVAFAVANRQAVSVSFDPFATDLPAFALSGPLFLVLILVLALGVVVGGLAAWIGQGRHRRLGRNARRDLEELRAENGRLKVELQAARSRRDSGDDLTGSSYPALPGQNAA